jgi:opacity protein-like surface antigen
MIRSRHIRLVRALSASVAAGALMLAAAGGAGAQSASPEKPEASAKAAKKKAEAPALATPAAPAPYAMVTKGPAPVVVPAWQGLYAGVSFGLTSIKANTATAFHEVSTSTAAIAGDGGSTSTSVFDEVTSASGRNWGALSDVYLGYNFRPGGNLVAGVQVEGTIANARAQQFGTAREVSNSTTVNTPGGATSTSSTVTSFIFTDALAERWAVSALGRLGVVIDPRNLVYGIGGYTRGGFEWSGRSFGLNGATVGAGWEHEIAPAWTLKAEYRFTAFQSKDLPRSGNSTASAADVFFGGATDTFTSTSAFTVTDHVSGIALHALRFGITHYFDADARGAAPYPLVTKAPPVLAMPWEGPYAGVSDGTALLRVKTSTVSNPPVNTRVTTFSNGAVSTDTSVASDVSNGGGHNTGALSDVFLGYNFRLRGNVIAGVQVEGTLAEVETQINPVEVDRTTATTVRTPGGATSTSVDLFTSTSIASLAERWAVSALGRLGVLIDPQNLVYGIGGYTRGGFEWGSRTFGLNGATVGAGWEHEIAPTWTLKAEYRYTAFADKDITRATASTSTNTFVSTTGVVTTNVSNFAASPLDHVSGVNLHALRFGITHYLSDAPLAPAPYAIPVKAPPVAGPVWTGLYGGVSFGLMSMHAKATSVTNNVDNTTETDSFGDVFTDAFTSNSSFSTRGRHGGAVADVVTGYNAALGPKLIGGVQLEGSLAHGAVLGNGSFVQTSTDTFVQTPPGGPAGTDVTTGTSSGTISLDVQSRWMASALARLGVLVDPRDLVYAIGGWSYGGFTTGAFSTGVHPFNLNGPTVGVGIEREVAPTWTLRAEYRYTHFLPKDVTVVTRSADIFTGGTFADVSTSTFSETDRISVDMHTVRFGIAHYFASR